MTLGTALSNGFIASADTERLPNDSGGRSATQICSSTLTLESYDVALPNAHYYTPHEGKWLVIGTFSFYTAPTNNGAIGSIHLGGGYMNGSSPAIAMLNTASSNDPASYHYHTTSAFGVSGLVGANTLIQLVAHRYLGSGTCYAYASHSRITVIQVA